MCSTDDDAMIFKVIVKSASKQDQVHDAILEGIAISQASKFTEIDEGAGLEKVSDDGSVHLGGFTFPFSTDQIKDVAVSSPYIAVLLKNGRACRFTIKHVDSEDSKTLETQSPRKRGAPHTEAFPQAQVTPKDLMKTPSYKDNAPSKGTNVSQSEQNKITPTALGGNFDRESATDMSLVSDYSPENKRRKTEADESNSNLLIFNENPSGIELSFEEQRLDSLTDFFQNVEKRQAELNEISNDNNERGSFVSGSAVQNFTTLRNAESDTESSSINETRNSNAANDPHQQRSRNVSSLEATSGSNVLLPPGFRPLADRLDFMKKPNKKTPASSEESNPGKKKNSVLFLGSCEWIATDLKNTKFTQISAMYSEFLLVSKHDGKLWSWPIDCREENNSSDSFKAFPHPMADFLGLANEKISNLTSSIIRTTILTESGKICTFFDSLFAESYNGQMPNLIQRLTKKASFDPKLQGEVITDIKCGHFYSAVLTKSGKVFWWGLTPEYSAMAKLKKNSQRILSKNGFEIGDVVALKEKKEEVGSLVMNTCLLDGPKIGLVKRIHDMDRNGDSFDLKHYTVELIDVGAGDSSRHGHRERRSDGNAEKDASKFAAASAKIGKAHGDKEKIWSSDNVIFLEERANSVGRIVALDGNYAVVEIKNGSHLEEDKQLKVCQKSSLTKVAESSAFVSKDSDECLVNERRYEEFIQNDPECIVDPYDCENQYNGHKALAISATKRGVTVLTNRISDDKAFLVHPQGLKEDNSKVFTCTADVKKSTEDMLQSDGNVTAEYEAACSVQCSLAIADNATKMPELITVDDPDVCLVMDSNGGFLPVRYGSCLLQSTVLDSFPLRMLRIMETRTCDQGKDGQALTVIAVPKKLHLVPSIVRGNRQKFDQTFDAILSASSETSQEGISDSGSDSESKLELLYEKSSGNQNILHLCATNLILEKQTVQDRGPVGNEVHMLERILSSDKVRQHAVILLKQRDALGCTPFTAALVAKNSKAAYCILKAVLEWTKSSEDNDLFREAICPSSVSGMTPIHHLIFNSRAELSPNFISTNGLLVSNLPSNYSPRMLLQLFKERYASVYRAFIPVPTEKWKIKTAREKLNDHCNNKNQQAQNKPPQQSPSRVQMSRRNTHFMRTLRHPLEVMNRADALRATAKQGLVMFSNIDELYQALAEMDKFSLVCEAERPHTGLMSFAKYILSVRLAEDIDGGVEEPEKTTTQQSYPLTRLTLHPTLQNTYLMFPRGSLTRADIARGIRHQRHILPRPMRASNMLVSRGGINHSPRPEPPSRFSQSSSKATKDKFTEDKETHTESYSQNDEDAIRCLVLATLLQSTPKFAALLNHQQETALAYYLKNAERLSPKGLFESLSKWRPCSSDNCLYHQYTKSMVSADDLLIMPEVFQQGFGTASGIQVSRDLSGGAGFASMASKAMNIPKASVNQRLDNAVLSLSGRIGTPNQEHTKLTHHTERVASLNQVGNVVPLADVSKSTEESVASVNQQDDVSASKQRDSEVNQGGIPVLNQEKDTATATQSDRCPALNQVENMNILNEEDVTFSSTKINEEKEKQDEEPVTKRPRSDSPLFSNNLPFDSILQSRNDSPMLNAVEPVEPTVLSDFGSLEIPTEVIDSTGPSLPFVPLPSVLEQPSQSALGTPDNSALQDTDIVPMPFNYLAWPSATEENIADEPSTLVNTSLLNRPLFDEILSLNNSTRMLIDSEIDEPYASSGLTAQEEVIIADREFVEMRPVSERFSSTVEQPSRLDKDELVSDKATPRNTCCCVDKMKNISIPVLQRFNFTLAELSNNWWSIAASILGVSFGDFQSKDNNILSAEKLDLFVSCLVSNPFPVVLDNFLKSISREFPTGLSFEEITEMFSNPLPSSCSEIIANYPVDRLSLLVSRRFLSSVIRRLSLCLSKSNGIDSSLRAEIGRFAKQREDNKDDRILKSIKSCLRSFSWLSVIEIFKAAEAIIEPVRNGVAKAQPRGIMSDLCGIGRTTRAIGPHSILGAMPGMHVPSRRMTHNLRSTNITIASRVPQATTRLGPTRLTGRDQPHSHNEPDNQSASSSSSPNEGSWATGIENNLGMNSPLAWTLNGHIRVSETNTSRGLPEYLQNIPDPSMLPSIHAGNCYLAQMYSRLVKEAVDLATELINEDNTKKASSDSPKASTSIKFSKTAEEELKKYAKSLSTNTWNWMTDVIDSIESQLRSGSNFDTQRFTTRSLMSESSGLESSSFGRPPNISQSYVSKPEEYLTYLLKKRTEEADNAFPVLDLMSYSHVTFVLDAHFYLLKNWPESLTIQRDNNRAVADEDMRPRNGSPVDDAVLKFFSISKDEFDSESFKERCKVVLDKARSPNNWLKSSASTEGEKTYGNVNTQREQLKSDWHLTISAFAKLFLAEAPGMERECFLAEHAGSAGRISRFQRSLAATREEGSTGSSQGRENRPLSISIKRSNFVKDGLKILISQMDNHPFGNLNVRFEGEEGTGPGVNRGFFTGFANALKAQKVRVGNWQKSFFCQPGQLPEQANVFAPVTPTTASGTVLLMDEQAQTTFFQHWQSIFEGIGRFIGLALWFNQTIPIVFTRPTLKYLLHKEKDITFEDFAYHDSRLFNSFSQMILDAQCPGITEEEFQDTYCCNFEAVLDGHVHELIPGGSKIKVTRDRALEYVRLHANYLMVDSVRMELQALQSGLHQMIPKQLLEPLMPEDLQLLLSGGAEEIDISRLKSMIRFNNSRVCSKETLAIFKGWFWSIVAEMSSTQRRQLLYFATGSAVLPAFDNKVGNNEELMVTVDVISKNNSPLPVVSTCGQRLSIPLYSTKKELKRKLLQAIQCLSYGLG